MDLLKQEQRRATKRIKGLGQLLCEERVRAETAQPGRREGSGGLIHVFKCLVGVSREDRAMGTY